MKFSPSRLFAFPVLGQNDYYYPDKFFTTEVRAYPNNIEGNENGISFEANFSLNVDEISNLIEQGKAVCMLWVCCRKTSYREIFEATATNKYLVTGNLSLNYLMGNLEFHPQIVTTEEVELELADANSFYESKLLELPAGSSLAVHKPSNTQISGESSGAVSIFQFDEPDDSVFNSWEVIIDINEPIIKLRANKYTYDMFQRIRKDKEMAVQTLYLAALVEVLSVYLKKEAYRELEPDTWAEVIANKLTKLGIEPDDEKLAFIDKNSNPHSIVWVAQRLLSDPIKIIEEKLESEINE